MGSFRGVDWLTYTLKTLKESNSSTRSGSCSSTATAVQIVGHILHNDTNTKNTSVDDHNSETDSCKYVWFEVIHAIAKQQNHPLVRKSVYYLLYAN